MKKLLIYSALGILSFTLADVCMAQDYVQTAENQGVWDTTKDVAKDTWDGTKNVANDVWDGTKKVSSDVWDGTKNVASDVKDGINGDEPTAQSAATTPSATDAQHNNTITND
ncbi:MAG: hypothetical protein IJ218_01240 [Alphaproteobacteria bacterium]|nr:hypothetical protein [Alphaproteobacteria bacterium]